jgi:hypothetical protein
MLAKKNCGWLLVTDLQVCLEVSADATPAELRIEFTKSGNG